MTIEKSLPDIYSVEPKANYRALSLDQNGGTEKIKIRIPRAAQRSRSRSRARYINPEDIVTPNPTRQATRSRTRVRNRSRNINRSQATTTEPPPRVSESTRSRSRSRARPRTRTRSRASQTTSENTSADKPRFNKSRFRIRNNSPSQNIDKSNSYEELLLRDPSYGVTPRRGTKAYVKYNDKQGNRKHDRKIQSRTRTRSRVSNSQVIPKDVITNDVIPLAEKPALPSFQIKSSKLQIKKFNALSRPEVPSLLKKIRNKAKKKINEETDRERNLRGKKLKEVFDDTFKNLIEEHKPVPDVANNIGVVPNAIESTLDISTIYPEDGYGSTYLKVATIRSPYSFDLIDDEGVKMSTRFVTVTRTYTSNIQATSLDVAPALSIIEPTAASVYDSFYQTENVLSPNRVESYSGFK